MSAWIDITRPVDDTLIVWPGHSRPERTSTKSMAAGDHCNVSEWRISAHTGTHMDSPLHFIDTGASIDQIDPDVFMGDCVIIDINETGPMTEEVAQQYSGAKRLLVKTAHSRPANAYAAHDALMSEAAARLLVDRGLVLIGTDRLSVDDSRGEGFTLHSIFLGAGCVIVEGLAIEGVQPGDYSLAAAPLRLSGTEASPCRALLRPRRIEAL